LEDSDDVESKQFSLCLITVQNIVKYVTFCHQITRIFRVHFATVLMVKVFRFTYNTVFGSLQ